MTVVNICCETVTCFILDGATYWLHNKIATHCATSIVNVEMETSNTKGLTDINDFSPVKIESLYYLFLFYSV